MAIRDELQELAERLRDMPPLGPDKPREDWTEEEYLEWVIEDSRLATPARYPRCSHVGRAGQGNGRQRSGGPSRRQLTRSTRNGSSG
jgi:hypothetical protein